MIVDKKIAVVGATGRVGREILSILYGRHVPHENITCIASQKSDGKLLQYGDSIMEVKKIQRINFSEFDLCFFTAGSKTSAEYAQDVADSGVVVVDNTSYFRMRDDVPLIVPEINCSDLGKYKSNIVANPNCSTIQMVTALKPLHDLYEVTEVVASTYQAVSGAGQNGVVELMNQIHGADECRTFHHHIAFNVIPQIGDMEENGFTTEEMKMSNETKKILQKDVKVVATCVRVPVMVGHTVSVVAKFKRCVNVNEAKCAIQSFPGTILATSLVTPLAIEHSDYVYVDRVRQCSDNEIAFICIANNLRKGAALNTIQIAEEIFK